MSSISSSVHILTLLVLAYQLVVVIILLRIIVSLIGLIHFMLTYLVEDKEKGPPYPGQLLLPAEGDEIDD
jgi:hypothetical protein